MERKTQCKDCHAAYRREYREARKKGVPTFHEQLRSRASTDKASRQKQELRVERRKKKGSNVKALEAWGRVMQKPVQMEKLCRGCSTVKPREEYYTAPRPCGMQSRCKECKAKWHQQRKARNVTRKTDN